MSFGASVNTDDPTSSENHLNLGHCYKGSTHTHARTHTHTSRERVYTVESKTDVIRNEMHSNIHWGAL